MKVIVFLFSVFVWIVSMTSSYADSCQTTTPDFEHMEIHPVSFINDRGDTETIQVRIADEISERSAGYQSLCSSASRLPILFVFPASVLVGFHMENVYFPIDIAFFDEGGQLIEQTILRREQPIYKLQRSIRYALEAPVGFLADHHLSTSGSRIDGTSLAALNTL